MQKILYRQFSDDITLHLKLAKPIERLVNVDRTDAGIEVYEALIAALVHTEDTKNPKAFRRFFFRLDESFDFCLGCKDLLAERAHWVRTQATDMHVMWKYALRRSESKRPSRFSALVRLREARKACTTRRAADGTVMAIESDSTDGEPHSDSYLRSKQGTLISLRFADRRTVKKS